MSLGKKDCKFRFDDSIIGGLLEQGKIENLLDLIDSVSLLVGNKLKSLFPADTFSIEKDENSGTISYKLNGRIIPEEDAEYFDRLEADSMNPFILLERVVDSIYGVLSLLPKKPEIKDLELIRLAENIKNYSGGGNSDEIHKKIILIKDFLSEQGGENHSEIYLEHSADYEIVVHCIRNGVYHNHLEQKFKSIDLHNFFGVTNTSV